MGKDQASSEHNSRLLEWSDFFFSSSSLSPFESTSTGTTKKNELGTRVTEATSIGMQRERGGEKEWKEKKDMLNKAIARTCAWVQCCIYYTGGHGWWTINHRMFSVTYSNRSQGGSVTWPLDVSWSNWRLMFDLSKRLALQALVLLMFPCIKFAHVSKVDDHLWPE